MGRYLPTCGPLFFSMHSLRDYQQKLLNETSIKLACGNKRIIAQLATGGGKTVCFSAIVDRYINKSGKSVLIIVHREELLHQTVKTIYEWYGITAEIVAKDMQAAKVYVSMVETLNNRLKRTPDYFNDVGLVIVDEVHIGNFVKIFPYFPDQYILGFTATPISASKKRPLKNHFHDIVCAVDIPDLIAQGSLVKNVTIDPKTSVDRSKLVMKRGEFDEQQMAAEYGKAKNVHNTLSAYEEWGRGTKTIIFNCNVEHSKKVNDLFNSAGYNSRHLDATCDAAERKEIFAWFKNTPDAILNNVGIATTGYDEPSIQTVIVNKATASLPLWLQMTGRGARPYPNKPFFRILDLGSNAATFGDWDYARDWADIFHNPGKPKNGVAPVKECPECHGITHPSKKTCPNFTITGDICGYEWPVKEYVEMPLELKIFSQNINIAEIIAENEHRKEYYPFFQIPIRISHAARRHTKDMSDDMALELLDNVYSKCREWCHAKGKKFNTWHKDTAKLNFYNNLTKLFPEWQPSELEYTSR